MSGTPVSQSRIDRVLGTFARFGLDLRPLAQHLRAAIIRPARHDVAQLSAKNDELTAQLATQRLVTGEEIAELRRDLALASARNDERAVTAHQELAEVRNHLAQIIAKNKELEAQVLASRQGIAWLRGAADSAARARDEAAQRLEAVRSALEREIAACRNELQNAATDAAVGVKPSAMKEQLTLLERLFIEHVAIGALPPEVKAEAEPVVSVILPTRDRAHVVAAAVASVQAQRYSHWELIIVDDGSRDATVESLAPFLLDERIHLVSQPPTGAAAARNRGLSLARGDIVAYLDSDNVWYPDFLVAVVAAFQDPDVDVAYGALVSESHGLQGSRILYKPFDRAALLNANFIDLNTVAHRRELVDRCGAFDERLDRLLDWDLLLRYTADRPATMLPVLAAHYNGDLPDRITKTASIGPSLFAIRHKWRVLPDGAKRLRVLYAVRYPQPGQTSLEAEIHCMLRWGVHVEVWCEAAPTANYPSSVRVHRGTLDEAISAAQPDLLHVHGLDLGVERAETYRRRSLPVTARAQASVLDVDTLQQILSWPSLQRLYLYPHQEASVAADPRLRELRGVFDTTLFKPHAAKDRHLVVAGVDRAGGGIQFVAELAKMMIDHRFVAIVTTSDYAGESIEALRDAWRQSGTPADLMVDPSREEIAALVTRAGHFLHTGQVGAEPPTPTGLPISIVEAMATGSHILVRDVPALTEYVAEAGTAYRDLEHAAEALRGAAQWSDNDWHRASTRSVDRAFSRHADETVLLPLLQDWCEIVGRS
jgi:glycosyltransferase involved in cell wall biosynthesis